MGQVVEFVESSRFNSKNGGPLDIHIENGHPHVFFVAGDNASGKSLLVQIISSIFNSEKIEPLQISMKYRTKGGMHRAFMFGAYGDDEESTGLLSVKVVKSGMQNVAERESPCALMLDEPDIGLSENYTSAMGEWIGQWASLMPYENCQDMVVVSHSKKLLYSLEQSLGQPATWIVLGGMNKEEWLNQKSKTIDELLSLKDRGNEIRKGVNKVINERKSANGS